ncbi:hypothetical protein UFOVP28_42 [uncultured Caudovirales phage]|uniref:Uncharacterized protein n=1 Tax=uncultured Caudovirales phage TaxID=2100421 RepID=A0A6J5KRS4_9CAUD|nr:hypothetical protein UFOVP28_42 [uncultured Caudovirales phage]
MMRGNIGNEISKGGKAPKLSTMKNGGKVKGSGKKPKGK